MSKRTLAVVDCHDRALHYVQKAIARKKLGFEGLTMVHFDAHPDFTIPAEVDQKTLFNKRLLAEKVSIESWIFPLVAAGHVSRLIWYKSPWSTQFDDGIYQLKVGAAKAPPHHLAVDSAHEYFLSEGVYTTEFLEETTKDLVFEVRTLRGCQDIDSTISSEDDNERSEITEEAPFKPWILDIDLDVYSTQDPFREILGEKLFENLKDIYPHDPEHPHPDLPQESLHEQLIQTQSHFRKQVQFTNTHIHAAWAGNTTDSTSAQLEKAIPIYEFVKKVKSIPNLPADFDAEMLCGAGASLTLPHHRSSEDEVKLMVEKTMAIVKDFSLISEPGIVTIARSVYDEYCPKDQVDMIQNQLTESIFTKLLNRNQWTIIQEEDD